MLKRIGFAGMIFLLIFGLPTSFAANKEYEVYLLNVGMNNPYYLGIMKGAALLPGNTPI